MVMCVVCGDDKQTTPNKFGKEVCAECVKLCCAECCGEFGEDCALPLKEGGALCRDCDPNYWAWQEARDAEEERTSPEEFAQALLEANPALAKMLYDHLADKFNNDPKEEDAEEQDLVCCGCDRPMEGEKDFGNNADVADTCCEECFNKHLAEQDE